MGGLVPGTVYHFRVASYDDAGRFTKSADATFTTVAITQARLTSAKVGAGAGGAFQFSFTNAPAASAFFDVLTSTNIAAPLGLWLNLGHPTEGPAGQYKFIEPQPASQPQQFYYLRQP